MPRFKMVNGDRIQFTAEEEAARDAEEKAWADGAPARRMVSLREQRNQLLAATDFSVVPSEFYVNITALRANSKYLCIFDGNVSASTNVTLGDGINGFGFLVDPAGGTSWTQFGSGSNSSNADNIKFFATRLSPTGGGNDSYFSLALNGNAMFTSSAAAGATLRFAIEYFHYDNSNHQTMYINRRPNSGAQAGNSVFQGGLATTLTVWEIAQ